MQIIEFIGTCSDPRIAKLALKPGRKSSWNNAKRMIKNYSSKLYRELALDFWNPWDEDTNIKKIGNRKILHIVHSQIDYLFELS